MRLARNLSKRRQVPRRETGTLALETLLFYMAIGQSDADHVIYSNKRGREHV